MGQVKVQVRLTNAREAVLAERDPRRAVYLAVPHDVFRDIFEEPLGQLLLHNHLVQVIGFDPHTEVLVAWLP